MISEIKRVKVLQAGNVGAALYGLIGVVLLLIGVVVLLVHQSPLLLGGTQRSGTRTIRFEIR
ncbi:MAG: hypothetical protein M1376_11755 [Planctomycetes bacterium]|nr:hypothetical protein [Planctomycetota bacterium]